MKSSRTARIIDKIAIVLGIINVFLFLVLPVQMNNTGMIVVVVVLLFSYLFLSDIIISAWGVIRMKSFFATWLGWGLVFVLFFIFSLPSQGVWQISNGKFDFFFSFGYLIMGWIVAITSAILVFNQDMGILVIAGGTLLFVWGIFFTWRIQGNLVEQSLLSIFSQDIVSPLWWLYPVLWGLGCLLIFSIVSFIFHTFKIFYKELVA